MYAKGGKIKTNRVCEEGIWPLREGKLFLMAGGPGKYGYRIIIQNQELVNTVANLPEDTGSRLKLKKWSVFNRKIGSGSTSELLIHRRK